MHIHIHAAMYKNVGECNIHMHTFMPVHVWAHILLRHTVLRRCLAITETHITEFSLPSSSVGSGVHVIM